MPQHHTLEEISETDASGRVAEIYAELRRLSGVPVVALIFRHLATHDGLLDQIWAALRPLLTTGVLQDAAARVVDENIPPDLIPPIDANVRCALGLDGVRMPPVRMIVWSAWPVWCRTSATGIEFVTTVSPATPTRR